MAAKKKAAEMTIVIPALDVQTLNTEIQGFNMIIFHKWSDKAKQQIRDKQMGKANVGKKVKDPIDDYMQAFYINRDGYVSFPALAVKLAMVSAARNLDGVPMTLIRGAIFVKGDPRDGLVPVLCKGKPVKPSELKVTLGELENTYGEDSKNTDLTCREDMVRVGMDKADLRYRPQLVNWSIKLQLEYNARVFSPSQVMNLLQVAGFSCGIGEWRPEKSGDSGRFKIV